MSFASNTSTFWLLSVSSRLKSYINLFANILQSPRSPELSKLALDLFNTTVNSIPSERAFSTMNFLQSKIRNRLGIEVMDKLCFIYINTRSLRAAAQTEDEKAIVEADIEDELLNLEDEIIQQEKPDFEDVVVDEELEAIPMPVDAQIELGLDIAGCS